MYGKKYTSFMQKLKSFAAYSMSPRVRFFYLYMLVKVPKALVYIQCQVYLLVKKSDRILSVSFRMNVLSTARGVQMDTPPPQLFCVAAEQ